MISRAKAHRRPLPRDMSAAQANDARLAQTGGREQQAPPEEPETFVVWEPPLPWWHRHQELLRDRYNWLEGAILGSNHGTVVALIEGGTSGRDFVDLEVDLEGAWKHDTRSRKLGVARAIGRCDRALARLTAEHAAQLRAIYGSPAHRGLSAFGAACNLLPWSLVAEREHSHAHVRASLGEWLVRLSARLGTVPGEQDCARRIREELSQIGHRALAAFVEADRRNRHG